MLDTDKTAIILVNLGTPDKPETGAVRRYLNEFLSDRRVVEGTGVRRWIWLALLRSVILTARAPRVADLYKRIWRQDSPMRETLNHQVAELELALQARFPGRSPQVFSAMTYGTPALRERLQELSASGFRRVLVIPMFAQYSATTTAAVYDQVAAFQQSARNLLDIRIVRDFHQHPKYIAALAQSIRAHRRTHGQGERLIISFHGIPQACADAGDEYPAQCQRTAELLAQALQLSDNAWQVCYQSRFGPKAWLQPYTDKVLAELAKQSVQTLDVVCPGFSADCLETLEEIAIENRDHFLEHGGQRYQYIPALNGHPQFIQLLSDLVAQQAHDWVSEGVMHEV